MKRQPIKRAGAAGARSARRRAANADAYSVAAFPKNPPKRDRKLRAWIASLPCLIGGEDCTTKTHAAHVPTGTGGMGMKGDDLFVPLCFRHHIDEQHGGGTQSFQNRYGVDLYVEAVKYRLRYAITG